VKDQHTVTIYALFEPGSDPWYVGCTKQSLNTRLAQHRKGTGRFERHAHLTPDTRIGVIERVTGSVGECQRAEYTWIGYGHDVGWPLVNTATGWRWTPGLHHTDETKRKISEAKRGHPVSAETRRRISEAVRGNVPWNKGRKVPV
jgi:hypothetical protein